MARKAAAQDMRRKTRPMRQMSDAEKGWVAGIIEGEGCLRFYDSTAGKSATCTASVVVVMTDEDVIRSLWYVTGLGNFGENKRGPNDLLRCKRIFRWAVTDRQGVLDLLTTLRPFFHTRRGEKADLLIKGIQKDIEWMTSRDRVFIKCGHPKTDDNVGYRYDRRRNLDVPFCKTCQKEGRSQALLDGRYVFYPWDSWTNGELWTVERGKEFNCLPKSFRTTLWTEGQKRGLKCQAKMRGDVVEFQFTPAP